MRLSRGLSMRLTIAAGFYLSSLRWRLSSLSCGTATLLQRFALRSRTDLTRRWSERRTALRSTFEMTSNSNSERRALSSAVADLVLVRGFGCGRREGALGHERDSVVQHFSAPAALGGSMARARFRFHAPLRDFSRHASAVLPRLFPEFWFHVGDAATRFLISEFPAPRRSCDRRLPPNQVQTCG